MVADLTKTSAETWNGYTRKLRHDLRRCESTGLTSEADADWAGLDDFIRLYYRTMQRNHAAAFYFFPLEYFQNCRRRWAHTAC